MFRLPPCTTHSDTLLPYASLFLSRLLDAKIPEAKRTGRDHVVVAQQGDLVTGEERLRQQLEQAGLQAGQAERQVHQSPLATDRPQQQRHDFRQAVDPRPTQLVDLAAADRKRTRLNSSHYCASRMPSS